MRFWPFKRGPKPEERVGYDALVAVVEAMQAELSDVRKLAQRTEKKVYRGADAAKENPELFPEGLIPRESQQLRTGSYAGYESQFPWRGDGNIG